MNMSGMLRRVAKEEIRKGEFSGGVVEIGLNRDFREKGCSGSIEGNFAAVNG